jgi:hypothetical protein
MADAPNSPNTESPSAPKRGQEFWAVVVLGVTALVCFSLMAVGLALILGRGNSAPSISNNPVINMAPPVVAPQAGTLAPPTGIQRPSDAVRPQNERIPAMDRMQPALPGAVGELASPARRKAALNRADPPALPSPPSPEARKVFFRVRIDPATLHPGSRLPMHLPYEPDAQGNAAVVAVSREPEKVDERFSYTADVPFAESGIRGQSLDLQLTQPRKTATVDGFRAPKGFQFFTAKLHIRNQGAQPVALRVDDLEVHDAEGVRYLANPDLVVGTWPAPSMAPSAEAEVELSFLVPEESPLKELAVQEAPGQVALVPLQAR